ncbi:ATP-binding cassette sub-family C member 4-like isoform X1 [Dermacentor albipictus]|uniref:ATP-binding cassette sub-family C member 4-like isoform X1 n=2 Tax=Dermacentor albipictus TaxID=60249 RepID=UPI0038FC6F5C
MDVLGKTAHYSSPRVVISVVLKWISLASLLLGWPELRQRTLASTRIKCYTLLDIAYLALVGLSSLAALTRSGQVASVDDGTAHSAKHSSQDVLSGIAAAAALLGLGFISLVRFKNGQSVSGFVWAVLGMLSTASVADIAGRYRALYFVDQHHGIVLSDAGYAPSLVVTEAVSMFCVLGTFCIMGVRGKVYYNKFRGTLQKSMNEDTRSPLGVFVCSVLFRHLKNVVLLGKAVYRDLPIASPRMKSAPLARDVCGRLSRVQITQRLTRWRLFYAVMRTVWDDLFWTMLTTIAYYVNVLGKVPLLERLVEGGEEVTVTTWLFVSSCIADTLLACYQMHTCFRLGNRVRCLLLGAIFRKMVRLSPRALSRNSSGYVLALLGGDCLQICIACTQFPLPMTGTLLLPVIIYLLGLRVGAVAALFTALWPVVALTLVWPATVLQDQLWDNVLSLRDERLRQTSDLLSSVRLVKMYAWEDAFSSAISRLRAKEEAASHKVNVLDGLIDSIYTSSASLMTILLFSSVAFLGEAPALTPAVAFCCLYLISATDLVTSSTSQLLRSRSVVGLAMLRYCAFFSEEEQQDRPPCFLETKAAKGEVFIEKCNFSWDPDKQGFGLRGISVQIEPGSLVGVVGFVGSGKSSLLAAILGDMMRTRGWLDVGGKVAYASQTPSIYNMSVRDNILFGLKLEPLRYLTVLNACELQTDLASFPAGDLTEVGEKGTTLSGGQRQRVALARAVYSDSDVYLFDDPLSGLDAQVASRVFRQVMGPQGLLRRKTRVLVCSQGNLLKHVERILLVHDRRVFSFSNLSSLLLDPNAPQTLRTSQVQQTMPVQTTKSTRKNRADSGQEIHRGKVTIDESLQPQKSSLEVVRRLLAFSGTWSWVAILLFVACAGAVAGQQFLIRGWTDAVARRGADEDGSRADAAWVAGLVLVSLCDVMFRCLGVVALAWGNRRLSHRLHANMLSRLLSSPTSFFDATPRGRIVTRFSLDLYAVDLRLFLSGKQCVQNVLVAVGKLCVVASQASVVVLVGAVGAFATLVALVYSVRAASLVLYTEAALVARAMQHVVETRDTLSTVRSFGAVGRFCRLYCRLLDAEARAFGAYLASYRVTRCLAALAGLGVVLATLGFTLAASGGDGAGSSNVGLALSSALSIPILMMSITLSLFAVLQLLVQFQRALEYTELPQEENDPEPHKRPSLQFRRRYSNTIILEELWPTRGKIEFQRYTASYRPGVLPNVLIRVNFVIEGSEKVGVVGRTGAGKSSLVQALLRVLVPTEGRILVDGVDISSLKLKKLRSAVTVIPQDPTLVTGSLRDNLDPTRSHTDAEIWDALRKSHLGEFVSRNPHGLDLAAGEGGANLSVGQRQLVCLARALLRRPKILVLDEATSQMDGDTDRLIQSTLRQCFGGCTLLAIAHRVNTVLDYDKILVMAGGEVAEFGPTKALLQDPASLFHGIARDAGAIPPNGVTNAVAAEPAVSVPRPRSSFVAARILSSVPQA